MGKRLRLKDVVVERVPGAKAMWGAHINHLVLAGPFYSRKQADKWRRALVTVVNEKLDELEDG